MRETDPEHEPGDVEVLVAGHAYHKQCPDLPERDD